MPVSGWNGKFRGVGNGGFAGYINYEGLASSVMRGYAVASTDTGHSTGGADWALGHPEKIVDYGFRGIHEMTVDAKADREEFLWRRSQALLFRQLLQWRPAGV